MWRASWTRESLSTSGQAEELLPFVPVLASVDGPSVRMAPDGVVVLPLLPRGFPFGLLCLLVELEERDQRGRVLVPKTVSHHATWEYSRISPLSRWRRITRAGYAESVAGGR